MSEENDVLPRVKTSARLGSPLSEMAVTPANTRFPVEVMPPLGFVPEDRTTWPRAPGTFEYVDGRLEYVPDEGESAMLVAANIVAVLDRWSRSDSNLWVVRSSVPFAAGRDWRCADVAVWRESLVLETETCHTPVLAVEIAGRFRHEEYLRKKASWYRRYGVPCVWLVLPFRRQVIVLTSSEGRRVRSGEVLPACEALPGLAPRVERFFRHHGPSGDA